MASVVDVLITEYRAVDNVTSPVELMIDAHQELYEKIERVQKSLEAFEKTNHHIKRAQQGVEGFAHALRNVAVAVPILSALQNGFSAVTDAVSGARDKVMEFGKAAIEQAGKMERLKGTFAGLYAGMGEDAGGDGGTLDTPLNLYSSVYRGAVDLMDVAHQQLEQAAKEKDLSVTVPIRYSIQEIGQDFGEVVWNGKASGGSQSAESDPALAIAKQKMDYLTTFAMSAMGQLDDLTEAATRLEASGLVMERFLPTVSNLAGAFGASKEKVLELSSAFGKLASGSSGEALEVLREFGITQAALKREGIQFDGGGQLVSSVEDALSAVEKIADEKFGGIAKYMGNTFEQRFSNLEDAWGKLLNSFGSEWLDFIGRVLDGAQSIINFFVDSGLISDLSKQLSTFAEGLFGDGLQRAVFLIFAALEKLPTFLESAKKAGEAFTKALSDGFVKAFNFLGQLGTDLINTFQNGLPAAIDKINAAIGKLLVRLTEVNIPGILLRSQKAIDDAQKIAGEMMNPSKKLPDKVFTPIKEPGEAFQRIFGKTEFGGFFNGLGKRADELSRQYELSQQTGDKKGVPDKHNFSMFNPSYVKPDDKLDKIKDATERTAKATEKFDLHRILFGGGDLAAAGVSLVDLAEQRASSSRFAYGDRGSGPREIVVKTKEAANSLERGILDVLRENLPEIGRALGLRY